jgi:exopolysaccharide biosynthesis WecB/TagA/CpsF family protein
MDWPEKRELFGVRVSALTYEEALDLILRAARERSSGIVDHMSVHGLALASGDAAFRAALNGFDIVAPDGHSVRWALNRFCGTQLRDRVYGPELMARLCASAAEEGVSIYLYGSSPDVLGQLVARLLDRFPALVIAGCESPPFRPLRPDEDRAVVDRINQSEAGLVFLGLGCPKQERFAYEHRESIRAVQLCVGAAFDFLAGTKKMAPRWVQDHGLEFLFRLASEPRRLWRRYLVAYSVFGTATVRALVKRPAEKGGSA